MLKARVPLLLDLPAHASFNVSLLHKDIRLALDVAQNLHAVVPSAQTADVAFDEAERLGYAKRDIAAMRQVLASQEAHVAVLREPPAGVHGA